MLLNTARVLRGSLALMTLFVWVACADTASDESSSEAGNTADTTSDTTIRNTVNYTRVSFSVVERNLDTLNYTRIN